MRTSIQKEGTVASERATSPPQPVNENTERSVLNWNTASLRARLRNNFDDCLEEIKSTRPDLIVLTEIRCQIADLAKLPEWQQLLELTGMKVAGAHTNPDIPEQKGLHGVMVLAKAGETVTCETGFRTKDLSSLPEEGRLVTTFLPWATIIAAYVPCKHDDKIVFMGALTNHISETRRPGITTIVTGDFNIAPCEADADADHIPPGRRGRIPGCTREERQQLAMLMKKNGLIDAWTITHRKTGRGDHTWHSGRLNQNYAASMRIDLALIDESKSQNVVKCIQTRGKMGSDHYGIILKVRNLTTAEKVRTALRDGIDRIEETIKRERTIKDIRVAMCKQDDVMAMRANRRAFLRGKKPCSMITTPNGDVEALLDSGAGPTLVREEDMKRLWPDVKIPTSPAKMTYLKTADNRTVGPVIEVNLPFKIAGVPVKSAAYVIKECPYAMLLGWEDMVMMGIDLFTTRGKATITDPNGVTHDITLSHTETRPFLPQTTMVVDKDTKIPAHGVYAVRVTFHGQRQRRKTDIEGMVETYSDNPDFLPGKLQHIVWKAEKGYAKIQIRNTSNRSCMIHRGTPVGSFQLEKPELTTVDPLLLVDISKEQLSEIVRETLASCPHFKEAIMSWFTEALQILRNKPKNPEEVKTAALAMSE